MTALLIDKSISELEVSATEAAGVLKSLSNEKRLMILCKLLEEGEIGHSVLRLGEIGADRAIPPRLPAGRGALPLPGRDAGRRGPSLRSG